MVLVQVLYLYSVSDKLQYLKFNAVEREKVKRMILKQRFFCKSQLITIIHCSKIQLYRICTILFITNSSQFVINNIKPVHTADGVAKKLIYKSQKFCI